MTTGEALVEARAQPWTLAGSLAFFCFVFALSHPPFLLGPYHPTVLVHTEGSWSKELTPLLMEGGELDSFPCKPTQE